MNIFKTNDLFDPDKLFLRRRYKTYLASSYDREGGNWDMGNFETNCHGEDVIMDAAGDGAITRIWSANPNGQLKMYFDGASNPAIDEAFDQFMQRAPFRFGHGLINRDTPEFSALMKAGEPLGYTTYAVLPFSWGCRITLKGSLGCYYQVNYMLFDEPHPLEKTSVNSSGRFIDQSEQAQNKLKTWSRQQRIAEGTLRSVSGKISLKTGDRAVIFDVIGAQIIWNMKFTVDYPSGQPVKRAVTQDGEIPWIDDKPVPSDSLITRHAKDGLEMRAYWDDNFQKKITEQNGARIVDIPSINAPLACFFMDYGAYERYESLFIDKNGSTYSCRWPMPFRTRGVIELRNNSCFDIANIEYEIGYEPVSNMPEDALCFHAFYHSEKRTFGPDLTNYSRDVMYLSNQTGELNYPILRAWGRGHFAGCSFNAEYSENPLLHLIESDEMVFIDDDPRRSYRGTGTEDYLNDAWGVHPVTGCLSGGRMTNGNIFGYRFHLSDAIPFENKLHFSIEHGSGNNNSGAYQSVAYYYLDQKAFSEKRDQPAFDNPSHRAQQKYFSL